MLHYTYLSLRESAQGIYKEKGSKFLAFAYPVSSDREIKDRLVELRKAYFDARHHCYAWMLGPEKDRFRAFDDGEPNHSAGDPILGQIRSKGITDVLIVVVRYFGGVKLGVGGLINAYKAAAEDALDHATIIEREITEEIELTFDYGVSADIMRLVSEFHLKILEQQFSDECVLKISFSIAHKENLLARLSLMKALGRKIEYNIL